MLGKRSGAPRFKWVRREVLKRVVRGNARERRLDAWVKEVYR